MSYIKNNQKGVDSMCSIIEEYAREYAREYAEEYANEEKAEMLVKHVDKLAETTESTDKACKLLGITRKQYDDAKKLLEKILTV